VGLFNFWIEFARLPVIYFLFFVPFALLALLGFYRKKEWVWISFCFLIGIGGLVFDMRVFLTLELVLIPGFVIWFRDTRFQCARWFFVLYIFVLNLLWFVSEKFIYFGIW